MDELELQDYDVSVMGVSVNVELSEDSSLEKSQDAESVAVAKMFGDNVEDCCKERCNRIIPKNFALEHRRKFQQLKKNEQDLVILAQLQTHRRSSHLLKFYTEKTIRGRSQCKEAGVLQRHSLLYYFCDVKICKNMYCWLHDLTSHRFYMLCKHFDEHGLSTIVPTVKIQKTFRKNHLLQEDDINSVVTFIMDFADQHGRPVPESDGQDCVIKLPSKNTKNYIYRKFCAVAESEPNVTRVARSTFVGIWKKYCPNVVTSRAAEDRDKKKSDLVRVVSEIGMDYTDHVY